LNGKVKSPRYVCLLARVYEDLEQLNRLFSCIKKKGPYLENIKKFESRPLRFSNWHAGLHALVALN